MQVTNIPPVPLPTGANPQDVARNMPQLQAQAAAPIGQRAVDPTKKQDRGGKNRSNGDRAKGGGGDKNGRGGQVNIRVQLHICLHQT